MTTLDQLAAQEQLHYQVITQRIDNLYTNLNSSNNAQTTQIVQRLNDAVNNLGGQLYTQGSRIITAITARDNAIEQETLTTVRSLFFDQTKKIDATKIELQQKLDAVLSQTKAEIDKQQAIVTANIKNGFDNQYTAIKFASREEQNLIAAIEQNIKNSVSNAITVDNTNTKNLLDLINSNVEESAKNTADNITKVNNTLKESGLFGGSGEPSWLTELMTKLYSGSGVNSKGSDNSIFTNIIRIIAGDSTANVLSAVSSSDVTGELSKQTNKIGEIANNLLSGKYHTIDDFNNALKGAGIESTILGGAVQLFFSILNIGNVISAFGNPSIVKINQFNSAAYSLKQLNDQDIIEAFIRNQISYDQAIKELDNLGHSKEDSILILKNSFPKFNPAQLLKLAHLGKINPDTLKTKMREIGWNEIDAILQGYLNQPRPDIRDLIQFAVKEVYSPESYTKFGQYNEFPKEFADRAKLEGLDEEYAKQYWAAHWQLPSPTMGYDMFHRRIISGDDLKALLKALDVMPYWRDKLIQLSYNVVGRVDTRRLYAYNVWDRNKVYQNYLDQGYSPKDSEDLTKFTVQYDDEQDNKHKTKLQTQAHNVYIKAYNANLLTKQDVKNKLVNLGYKSQEVDLELDLEDYEAFVTANTAKQSNHKQKIVNLAINGYGKRALSRKDFVDTLSKNGYTQAEANLEADLIDKEAALVFKQTIVKEIQKLYFESLLDDNGVLTKLVGLGFGNAEALNIIAELQILKGLDDKKPTPQQFEKMYKSGIISREEYKNILAEYGYNSKYIDQIILLAEA